jgi:hypothetical protein
VPEAAVNENSYTLSTKGNVRTSPGARDREVDAVPETSSVKDMPQLKFGPGVPPSRLLHTAAGRVIERLRPNPA